MEEVKWFVSKNPSGMLKDNYFNSSWGGDYNGYVCVHKSHPYFGVSYDNIPIEIHGGWTYGAQSTIKDIWEEVPEECKNEDWWIFGWDTLHHGDTREIWPRETVEKETARAAAEMQITNILKLRHDNRKEC